VIEPEETTVKDEETQVSVEPVIAQTPLKVNEYTSNKEGISNENRKKFVAIDKEPKTMFDELQKESLN
jgi:hypothetical protein